MFTPPLRFFRLLLEAIKKRTAKLASIAVETRKATPRDKDNDGDETAGTAEVLFHFACFNASFIAHIFLIGCF